MEVTREELQKQKEYSDKVLSLDMPGKTACVITFGCQQNEADSERIMGMLCAMGYTKVNSPDEASLIMLNTCAVREHAELKALSITGQLKHIKSARPETLIGICGCMVSQRERKDKIKNSYPYVSFLLATGEIYRLPEILYKTITGEKRLFYENPETLLIAEDMPVRRESGFKAWVSIMYGCNNFCTYCIVPYVRGRERSRRKEKIIEEVRGLAEDGYKEITLLGQNVNSYGRDIYEDYDFTDLLADICKVDGDFKVRFMTSHPKDATFKLIDFMAGEPKMAKQFHLPVQSGSDEILKKMNRGYDTKRYLTLIDYMRKKMPDIGISTDLIVGFPGETDEDFEQTMELVRRVRYDNLFSFIYSPRNGTPAAKRTDEMIDPEVKNQRYQILLETQNRISVEKNSEYIGKTVDVLCEEISKSDPDKITGRNEKNRPVHLGGDAGLIGKTVKVKILSAEAYQLFGELDESGE